MYVRPFLFPLILPLVWLAAGCHALPFGPSAADKQKKIGKLEEDAPPALPGKHSLRVSQFVFQSDVELKRGQPLFRELSDLRDQVYKELQLPATNAIVQVYIFEDRARYERYMRSKYPELPKRRAFFVAQPLSVGGVEDLLVYTYWGDRIHEDLRHELTHALLHSVLKDVPLWLDEGLAEYFEVPPAWNGVNRHHLDQIQRGPHAPFQPDLARLEQLSQVQQMAPAEYREAWAWVHLLLRGQPEAKKVLIAYLQQLRTNPNPGPLQPRLSEVYAAPDEALAQHLTLINNHRVTEGTEKERQSR
jgi:hypothetical protein